ncbi:Survival motor neuron [Phytophthora cactorum]|nr:Survival motor neuron [Phytophthora cactorum]
MVLNLRCSLSADRKHKTATRSNSKKAATSASIEEVEEGEERHERGHPAASAGAEEGIYGQPNAARFAGYATGTDAFAYQQQQHSHQQQTSSDVYQAAYAQAYAQLQAQFQAAYPAAAAQQPYGHGTQMPAFPAQSSTIHRRAHSIHADAVPWYTWCFSSIPRNEPSAAGSDDGFANLLMAWYQSGYYTGRFQAMQEMKMRGRR